jgi:uncharacterized Zn finger protein
MVKKQFGVTPWGARLKDKLQSLGGRVDRGEALARTGKVFDTRIRGSAVTTKVKGSSAPFYNVSCRWEPVSDVQRAELTTIVRGSLMLTAQVVSGNLPVELLDALEAADIPVLPRSYAELHGKCNCPDNTGGSAGFWSASVKAPGDPCKHQAAMLFELISELDKNPATLLSLRGIHLVSLLGIDASAASDHAITFPLPTSQFCSALPHDANESGTLPPGSRVTFPHMTSSAKVITQALSGPPPLFSNLDYTIVISEFYASLTQKKIAAAVGNDFEWEKDLETDTIRNLLERATYVISIPVSFSCSGVVVIIESEMWVVQDGGNRATGSDDTGAADAPPPADAMTPEDTLGSIPFLRAQPSEKDGVSPRVKVTLETWLEILVGLPGDGSAGSQSFRFFFHMIRAAMLMFSTSNFVPDIVPVDKGRRSCQWNVLYRPFASNDAVAVTMSRLQTLYPVDVACVRLRDASDDGTSIMLDAESGTLNSVSAMLTYLVSAMQFSHKNWSKNKPAQESLTFFRNQVYSPISLQDSSNAIAAKRWLSVFSLLSMDSEVLLRLSEIPNCEDAYMIALFLRSASIGDSVEHSDFGNSSIDRGSDSSAVKPTATATPTRRSASGPAEPTTQGWVTPKEFMSQGNQQSVDALKFIVALKEYIPAVETLLQDDTAVIDASEFERFVVQMSGVLQNLGVRYQLPRGIKAIVRPRLVTQLSTSEEGSSWRRNYLQMAQLMSYDYKIAVGDEVIDLEEFAAMVASGRRLFKFKDRYVELSSHTVTNILKMKGKTPPQPESSLDLIRDVISGNNDFYMTENVADLIASIKEVDHVPVPKSLTASLRPYQIRGYQWIFNNLSKLGGCILGDDMGLGKTIQTITLLLRFKELGLLEEAPVLVVCPTSLASNWKKELERFAPSLSVKVASGSARVAMVRRAVGTKRKRVPGAVDVLIMSYVAVRADCAELSKHAFSGMVADEVCIATKLTSRMLSLCETFSNLMFSFFLC